MNERPIKKRLGSLMAESLAINPRVSGTPCRHRLIAAVFLVAPVLFSTLSATAHDVRPAYLELQEVSADTFDVLWKVPPDSSGNVPAIKLVFPDDVQFLVPPHAVSVGNARIERSRIRRPGGFQNSVIRIDGLEAAYTDVLVRVEDLDGSTQVERLTPDRTAFEVRAGQGKLEVIRAYLVLGIEHILLGIDHLLFVLALLILVKGWKRLLGTITAFTLAHSITLALATLGFVTVPGPPVEAVIALSIVFVAMEIIHVRQGRAGLTERQPWIVAFTFGLLHGLGFAGALHEVGLPQTAIPLALLFFNIGVEVGQLIFVSAVLAFITLVRKAKMDVPPWMELVPPYVIGGMAMFWVIQRTLAF